MDRLRERSRRVEATRSSRPSTTALEAGLDALSLTLSPAARAAIDGHVRLLLAWTGRSTSQDPRTRGVATAHVVDSLSAVAILRERGVDRFIDLGSGGGYPGLPIAAALPAARALLLEPVGKKAAFLSTVVAAPDLDGSVEAAPIRAEALAADGRHRGRWPGVTVRAVATLAELVELAFPLLEPGGTLVAWKRGDLDGELAAAERAIDALGGGSSNPSVTSTARPHRRRGHRAAVPPATRARARKRQP